MASAQPPAEPQNSGNTTTTVRTTPRFNIDGVGARVIRGLVEEKTTIKFFSISFKSNRFFQVSTGNGENR